MEPLNCHHLERCPNCMEKLAAADAEIKRLREAARRWKDRKGHGPDHDCDLCAALRGREVGMDQGPWTVGSDNDRIDSGDFTHDASLILYGDFNPEDRAPYLQFIADQLNSCASKDARISALEKVVEAAQTRRLYDTKENRLVLLDALAAFDVEEALKLP